MHEIGLEEVRIGAENRVFCVLDEVCTKQRVAAEAVEVEVLEEAGRWRTTSVVIGHLFARYWRVVIMRWRRRYTIRHSFIIIVIILVFCTLILSVEFHLFYLMVVNLKI